MQTIGFIFGLAGLAFSIMAHSRISKLESKLKELKILDQEFSSGKAI